MIIVNTLILVKNNLTKMSFSLFYFILFLISVNYLNSLLIVKVNGSKLIYNKKSSKIVVDVSNIKQTIFK